MTESPARLWIAITNNKRFVIEADTHDQAAQKFQERMGYYPKDWQLELMERPDEPLLPEVELSQ